MKFTRLFCAIPLLLFINTATIAGTQEPPPPDVNIQAPPFPPGLPIDDHLWVLLIMGAFLGIWYSFRKKRTSKP